MIGYFDCTTFDAHHHGEGHPEQPLRLTAVREGLAQRNLEHKLTKIKPTPIDRALLTTLHDPNYIQSVEQLCAQGGGYLDADTSVVRASFEAALLAAGSAVSAVEHVLNGDLKRAFCAVRPPGHHALSNQAMGFCIFDNVALAAEAALQKGLQRVAIFDWDVHHGNGTQDLFWQRDDVLFISVHQYPFYPGTGAADEIGAGKGLGATLNCPIAAGCGDAEYLQAFNDRIYPKLESFGPEMIFISAGFDADKRDPLGGLCVTPKGFTELSQKVMRFADAYCHGRVVSVLEGGYDLKALQEDVPLHIETMF